MALLLVVFASCKTKPTKEVHPYHENMPEIDANHVLITKDEGEDETPKLEQLRYLKQVLKKGDIKLNKVKLAKITLTEGIKIVSVNTDRFIILDIEEDRLVEYNLQLEESRVLSERGHGPGDLFLSSDMSLFKTKLYVSNKDGRISSYDCSEYPCRYSESIKLEKLVPYSLATTQNEMVLLGSNKIPPQRKPKSDSKIDNTSLWAYNYESELKNSFGQHYDVNGHWMLQNSFSEGIVEYSEESNNYFSAFQRLPLIYLYDESYNLIKTLKISDFIVGEQEYDPKTGRLSIVLDGFSMIEGMNYISENKILLVVKTLTNRRTVNKMYEWDILFDYYALDSNDFTSLFLGSDSTSSKYFLTKEHIFYRPNNDFLYNLNY